MIKIRRYPVLLIVGLVVILLMSFVLNSFEGLYILMLIDLHALIAISVIPLIVLLMKYKLSEIGNYIGSIVNCGLSITEYKESYLFFNFQKKITIYSGILICCFSLLVMFRDLSPAHMGRCLGTGLCGLFYSILIILFYLLPTEMLIKNRILSIKKSS